MSYFDHTTRIKKFGGVLWYVNAAVTASGDGTKPETAFKTIGEAITACSSGDGITIMAGTYTEVGIDLNESGVELWFEIGAILDPASGTGLTVSGNYCWVGCHNGSLLITPAANETGIESTGNFNYFQDIRISCSSTADIGYDITGNGNDLRLCRCASPLIAAFKIQGDNTSLRDCCTGGEIADISIGFWATNSCDKTRLRNCGSQGHATAGYQVDAGCTNSVIGNCSSGGGDGARIDNGTYTTFPSYQPDNHVKKFGGDIWYVDKVYGSDINSGGTPSESLETIGEALSRCAAGDAINVKAGTYTETGLELDKDATELWCEIGVLIDPATGTALTISGNSCKLTGMHKITPAAGETGLLISGIECHVSDGKVSTGAIGIQITGSGTVIDNYASGNQTSIAYDIQGGQSRLNNCKTVGIGASIGYKINGGADTGTIIGCTSVGHETSGYSIATGSADWTILNCSSGAGDGRWVDVDHANVWSNFSFQDEVYHETDFSVVGGGAGSDNLFKVTGAVQILGIRGHVETALHADIDNVKFTLYDGASTDITDVVDSASAPAGSLFVREKKAADALVLYSSASAKLMQEVDLKKAVFGIVAKESVDTYVRFTWSGTGATGKIHFHIRWEPLTEHGFVEVV